MEKRIAHGGVLGLLVRRDVLDEQLGLFVNTARLNGDAKQSESKVIVVLRMHLGGLTFALWHFSISFLILTEGGLARNGHLI